MATHRTGVIGALVAGMALGCAGIGSTAASAADLTTDSYRQEQGYRYTEREHHEGYVARDFRDRDRYVDRGCWRYGHGCGWHGARRSYEADYDVGYAEAPPTVIERRTIVERPTIVERRTVVERPIIQRRVVVERPAIVEHRSVVLDAVPPPSPPVAIAPGPDCGC